MGTVITVGVGGGVGNVVAVGIGVERVGAAVSTMITGGVAVGSAALFGAEVAVGIALGVDVGLMTMTRGVGVAVEDGCLASVNSARCTEVPVCR